MTFSGTHSFFSDPFISSYSLYFHLCKTGFFTTYDNTYVRESARSFNSYLSQDDWVFLVPEAYREFHSFATQAKYKFNLIFGRSDTCFDKKWYNYLKQFNIKHIFAQNCLVTDQHDVTPIPLGIENPGWGEFPNRPTNSLDLLRECFKYRLSSIKDITLLGCFGITSNKPKRKEALYSILNHPELTYLNFPLEHSFQTQRIFYQHLLRSKFSLCPHGNGIDTHRFWLSLYLGAIPITTISPVYQLLCRDLPVLLIDNWHALHDIDLAALYKQLSPKLDNIQALDIHSLISLMVRRAN
jgi:hypothetical protein